MKLLLFLVIKNYFQSIFGSTAFVQIFSNQTRVSVKNGSSKMKHSSKSSSTLFNLTFNIRVYLSPPPLSPSVSLSHMHSRSLFTAYTDAFSVPFLLLGLKDTLSLRHAVTPTHTHSHALARTRTHLQHSHALTPLTPLTHTHTHKCTPTRTNAHSRARSLFLTDIDGRKKFLRFPD